MFLSSGVEDAHTWTVLVLQLVAVAIQCATPCAILGQANHSTAPWNKKFVLFALDRPVWTCCPVLKSRLCWGCALRGFAQMMCCFHLLCFSWVVTFVCATCSFVFVSMYRRTRCPSGKSIDRSLSPPSWSSSSYSKHSSSSSSSSSSSRSPSRSYACNAYYVGFCTMLHDCVWVGYVFLMCVLVFLKCLSSYYDHYYA